MNIIQFRKILVAGGIGVAVLAVAVGCATRPDDAQTTAKATAMLKASFKAHGQAGLDRLDQDETQKLCSAAGTKAPSKDVAEKIEKINLALIVWPADGKLMGDWKKGEQVAQSGRGMQWSDNAKDPAGGNCYACHQLAPQEMSFGTIGPSLYHFGKNRGYTEEMRKYAYGKVYNSEAFSACSLMPRFGHGHILTEAQIKDVVALLMDPDSPVNK